MDKETIIRVVDKITRGGAIETEEVIIYSQNIVVKSTIKMLS